jgi:pyruvate formate lyase activating enzyme
MAGKNMTAPEVLAEVLKDKPFYVQSGGGITLTGGEPLFQAGFAEALLKEARKHNLHTCVETSGYAAKQTFTRILPFTDIFLFDLKLQDATLHKKYTGTSNSLILSNLLFLNRNHASIHLRCPVIPHVNDNERHFRWLAETMRAVEHIESVELIPYHTYGLPKYLRFDIPVQLPEHTLKPEPEYIKTLFKHILQESSISLVQFENSLLWKRK